MPEIVVLSGNTNWSSIPSNCDHCSLFFQCSQFQLDAKPHGRRSHYGFSKSLVSILMLFSFQISVVSKQKRFLFQRHEHHGHPGGIPLLRWAHCPNNNCRGTSTAVFRAQGAQGSLYFTFSSRQTFIWFGWGVTCYEWWVCLFISLQKFPRCVYMWVLVKLMTVLQHLSSITATEKVGQIHVFFKTMFKIFGFCFSILVFEIKFRVNLAISSEWPYKVWKFATDSEKKDHTRAWKIIVNILIKFSWLAR